jgi:hypothetical protein
MNESNQAGALKNHMIHLAHEMLGHDKNGGGSERTEDKKFRGLLCYAVAVVIKFWNLLQ